MNGHFAVMNVALQAIEKGKFAEEIVPVEIPQRKGDPIDSRHKMKHHDEIHQLKHLSKLRPAFGKEGTITAGNAPGVNDGACALVLMSEERAKEKAKHHLLTIIGHAEVAIEPENFPQTPGLVINELLRKNRKNTRRNRFI